jgi:hypothetical protein
LHGQDHHLEQQLGEMERTYLTLALHLDRHFEGIIDAYFGPPELKADVEAGEPRPLDSLAGDARELQQAIDASDYDPQRKDYLTRQTRAMSAMIRNLSGESLPFTEEVELYFDIAPEMVDESVFEEAHAELDRLLSGDGPILERVSQWEKGLEVPDDRLLPVLELASGETRRRTLSFFDLPSGEEVDWELVEDKPWAAYNHYRGEYRSCIEVNSDWPAHIHRLLYVVAHEAYPGHHTEGAIKEHRLYKGQGRAEHAVQILGPEAVLAEGIAVSAVEMIFSVADQVAFLRDELCPLAGLDSADAERQIAVVRASGALRGVVGNAALLLHGEGWPLEEVERYLARYQLESRDRVARTLRFIQIPLWRSYAFNYSVGKKLLAPLLEGPDRMENFARLLREPFTPTQVRDWLAERDEDSGT